MLWGKGGRGVVGLIAVLAAFAVSVSGAATAAGTCGTGLSATVPSSLVQLACADKGKKINVIVQGRSGQTSASIGDLVGLQGGKLKNKFRSITGASTALPGAAILALAKNPSVLAITQDVKLGSTAYENAEMWRESVHVDTLWNATDPMTGQITGPAPQAPAIAIVDSGVDTSKAGDFGSRVVASVNLSSLSPGATGDDEGHGTMVADIAAGSADAYPGAAKNAPIVSVRTADKDGQSLTSDVIAAADWILAHKAQYNIKVANFSLCGSTETSFRVDPLDRAVEKLWFNGVTVVAAAGNHGSANGPVSMSYAPANDPFVITVGALDQHQTSDPLDDSAPYWSAYGYTMDGFSKPDLAAPGRYMIAAVPANSTIPQTKPDRVVAPGYIWMSGTSLAAPVVSGAAAQILARHPGWGPDEVKGALMLTSAYLANAGPQAAGVGEIDAGSAAALDFTPPNPNENLNAFIQTNALTGEKSFDQVGWASTVASNASWTSASWTSASWTSASWSSVNWSSVSWSSVNWTSTISTTLQSAVNWSEATYLP